MAGPDAMTSLWRNRAFVRLWLAQVVSSAGSQVTILALPLTAILVLGATPGQMGALGVAIFLPNLLVGLHAGVWVDRARRRPILIGADLGRAIFLGSIPVAAMMGRLTFLHLAIVGFAAGLLTVFFEVASTSILPSVVARAQLVEANGALASSTAFLAIAGPGAAGGLIQLLGAPTNLATAYLTHICTWEWQRIRRSQWVLSMPARTCCRHGGSFFRHG